MTRQSIYFISFLFIQLFFYFLFFFFLLFKIFNVSKFLLFLSSEEKNKYSEKNKDKNPFPR